MEQLMSLLPMIAIYGGFFLVLWLFLVRPQKKKQQEVAQMRASLKVGDEVITIGGIVGKIVKVKEDYVYLEVIKGANHMVATKWAIGEIKSSKQHSKKETEEASIIVEDENYIKE